MLIYLIDGNNLYHAIDSVCDAKEPRLALVDYLKSARLTGSRTNAVVIVFDGYDNSILSGENEYRIIYSKSREADTVIEEEIQKSKHKRQIVVVSDDHRVLGFAKSEGASVKRIEEFLRPIANRPQIKKTDEEKKLTDDKKDSITKELERIWVKNT